MEANAEGLNQNTPAVSGWSSLSINAVNECTRVPYAYLSVTENSIVGRQSEWSGQSRAELDRKKRRHDRIGDLLRCPNQVSGG